MTIPTLGTLRHGSYGVFEADPIAVPLFDGKPLTVRVSDVTEAQAAAAERAISAFLRLGAEARKQAEPAIFEFYREIDSAVDGGSGCTIETPSEVWQYVDPRGLQVSHHASDGMIYVQVFAECEWEPEHGLQLVYREGSQLTRVSEQDGDLE